jgi:hypothetical protein
MPIATFVIMQANALNAYMDTMLTLQPSCAVLNQPAKSATVKNAQTLMD